jgi:hypothetical protein
MSLPRIHANQSSSNLGQDHPEKSINNGDQQHLQQRKAEKQQPEEHHEQPSNEKQWRTKRRNSVFSYGSLDTSDENDLTDDHEHDTDLWLSTDFTLPQFEKPSNHKRKYSRSSYSDTFKQTPLQDGRLDKKKSKSDIFQLTHVHDDEKLPSTIPKKKQAPGKSKKKQALRDWQVGEIKFDENVTTDFIDYLDNDSLSDPEASMSENEEQNTTEP